MAYRVSIKSMVINLLLFLLKGAAGLLAGSMSLLADAVHSLTDIFSTGLVMIGFRLSGKPADPEHPYGHEKIECVIALLLGLMLFGVGAAIGYQGALKLRDPAAVSGSLAAFEYLAMGAALISIITKEWMYRYTVKCAKQIQSPSLTADAWHHRSDALSSIGSLTGVTGIYLGYPVVDVIACFIISLFIFKAAFDICADACRRMIDAAGDSSRIDAIKKVILDNPEVLSLDMMRTRVFGSKLYVDVEVTLDKSISFEQAHHIAHLIHDGVERDCAEVKHCMVHVNPSE
ncbi:MAG: cation diffusion facilitator family transporter [Bacillota bacterium]|nr:cation diffusion facilitator family transporter [Bacillota bacterium]